MKIPLDASKYLTDPCAVLSAQVLQGLGLPAQGKPNTEGALGSSAPSCGWDADETGVGVAFLKGNKNGLADLYRTNESGGFKGYWEEITVEGYPAVFADTDDRRPRGSCLMAVGISDSLAFQVSELGRLGVRACDHARRVATAVVKTLKGEG